MKLKFQDWYGSVICKQLDDGVDEAVDLRLSVMKPLCAGWCIDLFQYLSSKPDIGFKAAGIVDALSDTVVPFLYHFSAITLINMYIIIVNHYNSRKFTNTIIFQTKNQMRSKASLIKVMSS